MTEDARDAPQATPDPMLLATGLGTGLLVSELAEVYLLLDNVSSVAAKPVPDLSEDPLFKNAAGVSWIEQICEIRWPPDPAKPQNEALNAARLIRAKDRLNAAALPASGASIAFTRMMSGDSVEVTSRKHRWWQFWRSEPDAHDHRGSPPPAGPAFDRLGGGGGPRKCLASYAFPELYRRAGLYRSMYKLLHVCLVVVLLGTCLMSWRLAAGSSLLNDVTHSTVVETAPPQLFGNSAEGAVSNTTATAVPATIAEPNSGATKQDREITTRNLMTWVEENRWMQFLVGGVHQRSSYPAGGNPPNQCPTLPGPQC